MRKAEFERKLKDEGFRLLARKRGKHPIYTDGLSTIVMPSGGLTIERRLSKSLKIQLRKAIAKREQLNPAPKNERKSSVETSTVVEPTVRYADKPVPKPAAQATQAKRAITGEEAVKLFMPWRNQGMTNRQIIAKFESMGFTKKNGNPFSASDISKFALMSGAPRLRAQRTPRQGKQEAAPKAVAPQAAPQAPAPAPTLAQPPIASAPPTVETKPESLLTIIGDICLSNLDVATKRQLVKTLALNL